MDAATVTAIAALIGSSLAGAGALYGHRVAGRSQREGGVIGGYNTLTNELQEERKELIAEVRTVRAELAAERLESARLRLKVAQLGGHP
jgi:hypothetical protein